MLAQRTWAKGNCERESATHLSRLQTLEMEEEDATMTTFTDPILERELGQRGIRVTVTTVEGRPDLVSVTLPTQDVDSIIDAVDRADNVDKERDEARDDGYDMGHMIGYDVGYDAGYGEAISGIESLDSEAKSGQDAA